MLYKCSSTLILSKVFYPSGVKELETRHNKSSCISLFKFSLVIKGKMATNQYEGKQNLLEKVFTCNETRIE